MTSQLNSVERASEVSQKSNVEVVNYLNINRQMSEELLLNDRRGNLIQGLQPRSNYGCKKFSPPGFEPLPSRSTATTTNHCATDHIPHLFCNRIYISFTSEQ